MTKPWEEKSQQAKAIIAEVKEAHKAGFANQEEANAAMARVEEATSIMNAAKAEKLADDQKRYEALMQGFEQQGGAPAEPKPPTAPGPITGERSGAKTIEELNASAAAFGKQFNNQSRLVATDKAVRSLSVLGEYQREVATLTEGTGTTGGYLVVPQYMQNLFAETRRQGNAMRALGWMTEHPVTSNVVLMPRGGGAATVGIVAEGAAKPTQDQTYAQLTINIFTWAGISSVSRQLADDSSPTVADLVGRELGTLLGNLEEQMIINGTGSGEPTGILNTAGLASQNTSIAVGYTGQNLIDAILEAVVAINTSYFAPPTGALMHPKRLAFLMQAKDTNTNYLFNLTGTFRAPNAAPLLNGVTSVSEGTVSPAASLFGLPIGVSANIPTNLGTNSTPNNDVVIVGAWNESHWFQRQDVVMDVSDQASDAFINNKVYFRLEERAGYTAGRYPQAFATVTGPGMV